MKPQWRQTEGLAGGHTTTEFCLNSSEIAAKGGMLETFKKNLAVYFVNKL